MGDLMRIYYIFNIKDEYMNLYKESPNSLYNVLYQLYYMRRNEINYGYNLFNQLVNKIDKYNLDKYLFLQLHTKMTYVKKKDNHIINDLYNEEISILKIKRSYILINSNKSYTMFFKLLYEQNSKLFVCDFINNDYFYISDIKTLV